MRLAPIRALLAAVLPLWLATSAWAGFDEGLAAYYRGDYATALEEWLPVAEQGHADAQYNLGSMYDEGQGVPRDAAEAAKWHRKAAVQGHADAQLSLALMYSYGDGVPQDYTKAAKWYRLAAEQGRARAQYILGIMYVKGQGVPQDYFQAHMWWNLAAALGLEVGRKDRDLLAEKMTPADISEAQRLAREWLEEHGE